MVIEGMLPETRGHCERKSSGALGVGSQEP